MKVTPLHPLFAARVSDVDVRNVDAPTFAAISEAFERYSVLIFPGQPITDNEQIAFSERFGSLEITKGGTSGAGTKLVILSNLGPNGGTVPPTDRAILNNKANRSWHTDSSFKAVPARASMLSGREVPRQGGETEYASMRAAWAELPEALKAKAQGKVVFHDYAYGRTKIAPHLVTREERAALPPIRQALVLEGNRFGPALYLGAHAARVEGMDKVASRALLDELLAFATQERFIFRHKWAQHDLVLWDNRAVLHRATPFRSTQERRHMVRTTITGSGPTLPVA